MLRFVRAYPSGTAFTGTATGTDTGSDGDRDRAAAGTAVTSAGPEADTATDTALGWPERLSFKDADFEESSNRT